MRKLAFIGLLVMTFMYPLKAGADPKTPTGSNLGSRAGVNIEQREVPEPGSLLLMGLGTAAVFLRRRRS